MRYTHDLDLVFSVCSDKENWEDLMVDEILEGLKNRVLNLMEFRDLDAYGHCQTMDNEDGATLYVAGEQD